MDYYIESFHKAFPGRGLKNGGREFAKNDRIHIQYQPEIGGPDINKPFHGPGDPSLFIKRAFFIKNPGLTCSFGIKPRIGKKSFINSKTTDFGISLNSDYTLGILYLYGMAGYNYYYGEGNYSDALKQSKNYMYSSALGAGITLFKSFYFSVQFYGHTSLYDTGIKRIDCVTLINSYSARWQMNKSFTLQFSIDQDAITYAAADIALSLKCEYTF